MTGYRLEEQVGFLIRRAHQRASAIFADTMAAFEVTPTQLAALAKLSDVGSASQNELGRMTAMDPATISGVAGRLLKRGWVHQTPSPDDGRLIMLQLTPEGAATIEAMKVAGYEVSRRTLEPLSPAERAEFLRMLAKMG